MKKKANIEKVVMDGSRRGTDVIGDDETIRFWVGEDIYLECHIKDGRLNVRSTPVGSSHQLSIRPVVGNVVSIGID